MRYNIPDMKWILIICVCLSAALPAHIFASGTGTNIVRDGDTVYLSVDQPTSTNSATKIQDPTLNRKVSGWANGIVIPDFFYENVGEFLNFFLRIVVVASALLTFFYLIWGALEWITSGGDKGNIERARSKMIAAVIGLVLVSASLAIYLLVLQFFGIGSINDLFSLLRPST